MTEGREAQQEKNMKRILLLVNCLILAIGTCGGPLVMRLYFIHGGNRVWLSSFLQTTAFPLMLLPLSIIYFVRRCRSSSAEERPKMVTIKPPLFFASAIIGVLTGVDGYFYGNGVARLPVSTSSLVIATQLAFTAVFAFFMVKQKFTAFSVNAVVLLTVGVGVLAMRAGGDRPSGESSKQYLLGFAMTLLAAALFGFILPLTELAYQKCKQPITYPLVLEIQLVMGFFATIFSIIGMIINNDFQAISREARHFGLGEAGYYAVLVVSAITWQCNFLGAIGVIFCASSLVSGIMIAVFVPITEVLAVIFYREKFQAEKGVSLVLCLWGFISYFYGEFKQAKKMEKKRVAEAELPEVHSVSNL